MRCTCYHNKTGERCQRQIGKSTRAQRLKLCAQHLKVTTIALFAELATPEHREWLARGDWEHESEIVAELEPRLASPRSCLNPRHFGDQ